jgi:hypothetical protein
LLFSALANSRAEGAGNIISQITTNANAEYSVVYNFSEQVEVNAPANLALLGLGLLAFARLRKASK